VIAVAGIGVAAIVWLSAEFTGDVVHCHGALCAIWTAALTQAAFSCLLAAVCLIVAAIGIQPVMLMTLAGGAFAFAAVQTVRGDAVVLSIIPAMLTYSAFLVRMAWRR
jgi:hypothetical protein